MPESADRYMRLVNGHLKMDEDTLTDLFTGQLNNIYCAKKHLVTVLPTLAEKASFHELKKVIIEGIGNIKMQILRMDVIYQKLGATYNEEKCIGVRSIAMEAYMASHAESGSPLLMDMCILTHLRIIESIEVTCFDILTDIATSLKNDDIVILMGQNLRSAINTKRVFELISQEYIF